MRRIADALLITALFTSSAFADGSFTGRTRFDLDRPEIRDFVEVTAAAQKVAPLDMYRLLAKAEPQPKIIEAMTRPAEKVSPWYEYRARFMTEQRIAEGTQFMLEHRARLEKARKDTGVAPEYIVAIIGVETFYGRITGKYRVLDALATLAFDYPPRGTFFREELAQFIQLSREESVDPLTALGSYAGAMGAPQFMPSSYRRYAVDGSGDKQRNLFADWDDVIASVANYFKQYGWVPDGPVLSEAVLQPDAPVTADPTNLALNETVASLRAKGVDFDTTLTEATPVLLVPAEQQNGPTYRVGFKNFEVITRYNRSVRYAMAVHDLATTIAGRVAAANGAPDPAGDTTKLAAQPAANSTVARSTRPRAAHSSSRCS
jgi:membrane-bound lytic murein transglycosylase B